MEEDKGTFSPREREVAVLIADGWTNTEIADHLGISTKTVDSHRLRLLKKMGVDNNVRLVRLAIREGLVVA